MLAFLIASMAITSTDPVTTADSAPYKGKTLQCREMGSAASRSQAIIICRTKAQWVRFESCRNPTRYCAPANKLASLDRPTPFPMNENSRVVCRKLKITGTRLASANTCLPQREWQRLWDDSRSTMGSLQDKQSTRPEMPR